MAPGRKELARTRCESRRALMSIFFLFLLRAPGMRLGGLACAGRGLAAQALDLAPGQGDADLPDPFQLHPVDRLGVEAREVDQHAGFSRWSSGNARPSSA